MGGGALFVKLEKLELPYLSPLTPAFSLAIYFQTPTSLLGGRGSIFQVAEDSDKIPDWGRKMLLWDYFSSSLGSWWDVLSVPNLLGDCVILHSDIDRLKV